MTKYLLAGLLLFSFAFNTKAQESNQTKKAFSMPSRDYVMIQLGTEQWTNAPDSIKMTTLGRVFNAYILSLIHI